MKTNDKKEYKLIMIGNRKVNAWLTQQTNRQKKAKQIMAIGGGEVNSQVGWCGEQTKATNKQAQHKQKSNKAKGNHHH